MKTIVLSAQKPVDNEIDIVVRLFELGLTSFHLRKPHYSKQKMRGYLDNSKDNNIRFSRDNRGSDEGG